MAFVIKDTCINCGACKGECPVHAISGKDDRMAISVGECIECGACRGACPADAIYQE